MLDVYSLLTEIKQKKLASVGTLFALLNLDTSLRVQSKVIFAEIAHPKRTHGAENFGAQEMLKRVAVVFMINSLDPLDPPHEKKVTFKFSTFSKILGFGYKEPQKIENPDPQIPNS